jgi:hypothetical protein
VGLLKPVHVVPEFCLFSEQEVEIRKKQLNLQKSSLALKVLEVKKKQYHNF